MVSIVRNEAQTGVKRYVSDKKDELSSINLRTTRMGSTCFVIENNTNYILNGSGEWVALKAGGASGGGSDDSSHGGSSENPSDTIPSDTPIDPDNTYIWDGGEVI